MVLIPVPGRRLTIVGDLRSIGEELPRGVPPRNEETDINPTPTPGDRGVHILKVSETAAMPNEGPVRGDKRGERGELIGEETSSGGRLWLGREVREPLAGAPSAASIQSQAKSLSLAVCPPAPKILSRELDVLVSASSLTKSYSPYRARWKFHRICPASLAPGKPAARPLGLPSKSRLPFSSLPVYLAKMLCLCFPLLLSSARGELAFSSSRANSLNRPPAVFGGSAPCV